MTTLESSRDRFILVSEQLKHLLRLDASDAPRSYGDLVTLSVCVDDLWFDLAHDDTDGPQRSLLNIVAVIGTLPETGASEVVEEALHLNLTFIRQLSGGFELDPDRQELKYVVNENLDSISADELHAMLTEMSRLLREWRARFPQITY